MHYSVPRAEIGGLVGAPLSTKSFRIINIKALGVRALSTLPTSLDAPKPLMFHEQSDLTGVLSSGDITKWRNFINSATVFVHHEGHCANTLITELKEMGVKHIVLVSKKAECDAEDRVSGKIIIDDFNNLESNYSAMGNYCKEHEIELARVLVGWGYSSESREVPIQTARVNEALPGCDFGTPCNSVETLQKIADKDAFDQTVSKSGLNVIPNYYKSFERDFDDDPKNLIKFAKKY